MRVSRFLIASVLIRVLLFSYNLFGYEDWQVIKGEHFLVYFRSDRDFARKVLNKAEYYYKRIARDLGYERYCNFWLWENRAKIYIYPDRESFLKESKQPSWSGGMADYTHKKILSFKGSKVFLNKILPHEMTHLIFRDYIGFKGEVPLWLDEGVAMWEEEGKRQEAQRAVKILLRRGLLLNLNTLTDLDVRRVKDEKLVHIFYTEAISLVGFMIKRYGADNFVDFCRQLRDGKSVDEALSSAYPSSISGLKELEKEWLEYLGEGGS